MTYKQFIKKYIEPYLSKHAIANRILFKNAVSILYDNKDITEKQFLTWKCPETSIYYTKSELETGYLPEQELQLIHTNGVPFGIRDSGGYLLFFPTISKYLDQEDEYSDNNYLIWQGY